MKNEEIIKCKLKSFTSNVYIIFISSVRNWTSSIQERSVQIGRNTLEYAFISLSPGDNKGTKSREATDLCEKGVLKIGRSMRGGKPSKLPSKRRKKDQTPTSTRGKKRT